MIRGPRVQVRLRLWVADRRLGIVTGTECSHTAAAPVNPSGAGAGAGGGAVCGERPDAGPVRRVRSRYRCRHKSVPNGEFARARGTTPAAVARKARAERLASRRPARVELIGHGNSIAVREIPSSNQPIVSNRAPRAACGSVPSAILEPTRHYAAVPDPHDPRPLAAGTGRAPGRGYVRACRLPHTRGRLAPLSPHA
ncbi:hypothetical protein FTUN_5820 [Frigoriglobus tundricola]|uniref:Uncharacterized protein n=1 Tax=Frigoriglobus tundricola TaxID=2774151 RepID=A0A6M5YXV4_9BACT|nr:hypothetical protein FTUN_5820 [Frigoriglobus tundricola]